MNTISNELINIFSSNIWQHKNLRSKLKTTIMEFKCLTIPQLLSNISKTNKQTKKILQIKTNYFWLQNNRKKCLSELHANQNWTDPWILQTPSVWDHTEWSVCYLKLPQSNISAGGEVYRDNHPQMINTKQKLLKNFFLQIPYENQ